LSRWGEASQVTIIVTKLNFNIFLNKNQHHLQIKYNQLILLNFYHLYPKKFW